MKTIFVRIGEMLSSIQWKQAIAACCLGVILLTTQFADANIDSSTQNRLNDLAAEGQDGRPRTTGQWQSEKESLEGQPGQVIKRMGKEAADAAGNAAETYGQTIKDLAPGTKANRLPQDD